MRSIFILFILCLFASCAQKSDEQVRQAIDVALSHLSKEECNEAIKVLEAAGVQNSNAIYLQVLASAYACKGGYDEIAFIADDLLNLNATTPFLLFQSLSTFSLSSETAPDSANYVAIRTGLNLLLNSTTTVGQTEREAKFGSRKAGDMGVQALMLNVVNFGKFINLYGNVDSSGEKGQGAGTNTCFINYTDARAQLLITALPAANNCNSNTDGHPGLSLAAADLPVTKRRLCEGLMTVTNLLDILNNVDISGSSDLSALQDIADQVNTYKTVAEAAGLGTLINTLSQSECETLLNTASNLNDMQLLVAILFETGLQ